MIAFHPISIQDQEVITSYTIPHAPYDCEYSFGNLLSWHFMNESSYAVVEGCLVIRFRLEDNSFVYLTPIGEGDVISVIRQLEEESKTEGMPFKLRGTYSELNELLERHMPTLFEYKIFRDYFDYVYLRKDLVELKGKNYHQKRNHVNKFKKEYAYRFTPLTTDMLPYCMELEMKWCKKRNCTEETSMQYEYQAFQTIIQNYEALNMQGGAIWVNDEIVAFTLGSPINYNTFDIQFEKADTDIDGAYNIINQEFANHLPEQYIYLNREEDMGVEGLRKAKLSYHPVFLVEKCIATKKDDKH